ncbi:hypothetical protein JCM10213_006610 [Rhodosporidiobolus nylandii]
MVPQPVWHDRPAPAWLADPEQKTDAPLPNPEDALPKDSTNVSGRWWKAEHKATARAQGGKQDKQKLDKKWAARMESRKRDDAVKKLERDIKQEKEDEAERKKQALKERREKEAEKKRLQEMAARMSAKKLQRMKKRMGRSKKVAQ